MTFATVITGSTEKYRQSALSVIPGLTRNPVLLLTISGFLLSQE
jgi:hypothetical protein